MNGFVRFANTALSADRDEQTRSTRIDRLVSNAPQRTQFRALTEPRAAKTYYHPFFIFFSSTPADPVPFRHADGAVGQCAHVAEGIRLKRRKRPANRRTERSRIGLGSRLRAVGYGALGFASEARFAPFRIGERRY